MSITLTVSAVSVALSADLYWSDELSWAPVEQVPTRTITGALVVQMKARIAGRPITLQPDAENSGWMTRAVLDQLTAWAAVPGQVMQLTLRGVVRDVIWRHQDGNVVDAKPVMHFSDVVDTDNYVATLRFMEI